MGIGIYGEFLYSTIETLLCYLKKFQEIVSAGGKTVWGDPAEVGKVVGGAAFDVVLDNNGKDLDAVRFVALVLETQILNYVVLVCYIDCKVVRYPT